MKRTDFPKGGAINSRIVDRLYCEGLVLSDEVRATFDLSGRTGAAALGEDMARIALSCEALRTTTRMMHAIAWLLNYRAFFSGELSEFQLRRHGRLNPDLPHSDPERLAMLSPEVCVLIATTERFYARLVRLDRIWCAHEDGSAHAVGELQERLRRAVAG